MDEPTVSSDLLSAFRLSLCRPAHRGRPGSGLFKLPPGSTPDLLARVAGLAPAGIRFGDGATPLGSPTRCLAPRPGFEPGAAGLTVRLPYPPGPRGTKKPRSFGRGSWKTALFKAVIRWSPPIRNRRRWTGRAAAIHGARRRLGKGFPPGAAS